MKQGLSLYRQQVLLLTALCASSLMSVALCVIRVSHTGSSTYVFLVWNLFLAWIPLSCALAIWLLSRRDRRSVPIIAALLACWLIFFPNAPYLFTDLIHLAPRQDVPIWYDLIMLISFVWNGLILGFVSLWIVQNLAQERWGYLAGWLVAGFTLAAGSFGIYLGRFLRWNSWDLIAQPAELTTDILDRLINPLSHPRTMVVSILVFGFLSIAYITSALLMSFRWRQEI